ncbi:MAG: 50S ribosomal protein L13 [Aquificaceae bacterium]
MKTYRVKEESIERKWWVVNAKNKSLGRLASEIAKVLRGKHKPYYQQDVDCGDFVIVVNADKVGITGKKLNQKVYHFHSNYPGGLKDRGLEWMIENKPEEVIKLAVKIMLPKKRLGHRMLKRLKVYRSSEHQHHAQKPEVLEVKI